MKQNIRLSSEQQKLVEEHLSLVHWTIIKNIYINPSIFGLNYEDLYQEGCLLLCQAAFSFDPSRAQFATYAKKVVRNGLISYCRSLYKREQLFCQLELDPYGELISYPAAETVSTSFDERCSLHEVVDLLETAKHRYGGITRKGIAALELKVQGHQLKEIAALYQVPSSHVGAWISRACEKLRNDSEFLSALR